VERKVANPDDAELVRRTRSGDNNAYGELVSRYQGHVYGLAYSLVGNWTEAQDIAQETFIRAYTNLDQLRDPARFAAWLRRVAFGVAMNWLKAFRPKLFQKIDGRVDLDRLEIPDFRPGPSQVAQNRELAHAVIEAVDSLPPKYRVPLTMFHLDGLSYKKVADFLDIPLGTVQALIHRARAKLKVALAAYAAEEISPMVQEVFNEHKLGPEFTREVVGAVQEFKRLTGNLQGHMVVAAEVYWQPPVYLMTHLVQMRVAGWEDMDFDTLAAVSGASALFAWQPNTYRPKYADLLIGMDKRIAEATGFGYEWIPFADAEDAWKILKESVDSTRPAKGWHYENVLFAGYRDAATKEERQVFAMADGPGTYALSWAWAQFKEWVALVGQWNQKQLGRHSERLPNADEKDVAVRVMRDLVDWSVQPPESVRQHFPRAKFGLAGIEAFADAVADISRDAKHFNAYASCHALNPQWTMRNSTALYLSGVAGRFPENVRSHILAAAKGYRGAYKAWDEMTEHLPPSWAKKAGWRPDASDNAWELEENRRAGAAAVREALRCEKAAVAEIKKALRLIKR
jgi:RNA polymerase sigma-70 factor (ECF subfamily)